MATKTLYWRPDESKGSPDPPAQCTLQRLDLVARHGNRMPVLSDIVKLDQMVSDISPYSASIPPAYQWMINWTVPYPTTQAGYLILEGEQEHYDLSKRFLDRFPSFFQPYTPSLYNLSSTFVSRTGVSASSFVFGLFEGTGDLGPSDFQPVFVSMQSGPQDTLLRFFDTCQVYVSAINNGTINKNEQKAYIAANFPAIASDISTKLGLSTIWEPTLTTVSSIFSACSYDLAINNITNHWCSLLSQDHILAWEYSQDLSNYWVKSYGHRINYMISSGLLQDIVSQFDSYIVNQDNSNNTYSLRFAHAETVIPLVTLLGLYKDPYPLLANATAQQIANRSWRVSQLSPYAANVAFFLYDCGSSQYKVRVDHNEIATFIPGCDNIYCDYQVFKSVFSEALKFNWTESCTNPPPPVAQIVIDNSVSQWKIYLAVFTPLSFIVGLVAGMTGLHFLQKSKSFYRYTTINRID
eukprot:gene2441-2774_t